MAKLQNVDNIRQQETVKLRIGDGFNFNFYDVVLALVLNAGAFLVMGEVYAWLRIPFVVYTLLFTLFLIVKPKSNPGRTHYQLMFTALKFDRKPYYSIDKNDFLYDE